MEIPRKKRGDPLYHQEVNELAEASRIVRRHTLGVPARPAQWRQLVMEITEDRGGGIYGGKLRYYDGVVDDEWKTDDDPDDWELDASCLGLDPGVGDLVVAYWDEQRGMFIPILSHTPTMIRGQLTYDLDVADPTFEIDGVVVMQPIGAPGMDSPVTIHNVFHWEGDNNGECVAAWNQATGRWEAIQVECPA